MIRRDYILRMIEQFGEIWAQLVKQLQAGIFPSMRATLDLSYQQLLGLAPERVRIWSSRELLTHMLFGMDAEHGRARALILSAMLSMEGDLAHREGDEDGAAIFRQKSLDLLLAIRLQEPGADLPTYAPSVDALVASLAQYTLAPDTNRLLLRYYEERGAYAQAEDALFALLEQTTNPAAVTAEGVAFYNRLVDQSDERLRAGNFSREEISGGLEALYRESWPLGSND